MYVTIVCIRWRLTVPYLPIARGKPGRNGRKAPHRRLVIAVHVLTAGQTYQDLGPTYHDDRNWSPIVQQTAHRLENLGFQVTGAPADPLPTTE